MQKISKIKFARTVSQIIFLILYPGLFALSFSEIGNLCSMLIHGTGNVYSDFSTILTAAVLLIITATLGRFFCGWMCTFGAMNDLLYYLNIKIFKNKFNLKVSEDLDSVLKYLKYIILLFIFFVFWIFKAKPSFNTNPWTSFANIVSTSPTIPSLSIGLVFLIFIIICSFFIERFFCRYLCPLGAIFAITSKLRFINIAKPKSECGKCTACTHTCSMGLKLYAVDKVKDGDCINCFKCIDTCPKNNARVSLGRKAINTMMISAISILSFFALYNIKKPLSKYLNQKAVLDMMENPTTSNLSFNNNNNVTTPSNNNGSNNISTGSSNTNMTSSSEINTNTNTTTTASSNSSVQYTPGTYTGSAFGHSSEIDVSVTVSSNKIDSVKVTQINDTPGYYEQPMVLIPQEILDSQSTNVDVVSGATYSSMGIINAVKKALGKAVK